MFSDRIKYRFTKKEKEKIKRIETESKKLQRMITTRKIRIHLIEQEIELLQKQKFEIDCKRYPIIEKLQKRCKHKGETVQNRRFRDFGSDTIRTWCCDCGSKIDERDADN